MTASAPHLVLPFVAVVAVLLLTLGPPTAAPLAGLLLAVIAVTAATTSAAPGADGSGVGDEPVPLRP